MNGGSCHRFFLFIFVSKFKVMKIIYLSGNANSGKGTFVEIMRMLSGYRVGYMSTIEPINQLLKDHCGWDGVTKSLEYRNAASALKAFMQEQNTDWLIEKIERVKPQYDIFIVDIREIEAIQHVKETHDGLSVFLQRETPIDGSTSDNMSQKGFDCVINTGDDYERYLDNIITTMCSVLERLNMKPHSLYSMRYFSNVFSIVRDVHRGETRRYTGLPYWVHPVSVAMRVYDNVPKTKRAVAVYSVLLHDTIESQPDSKYSTHQHLMLFMPLQMVSNTLSNVEDLTNEFTKESYPELNRAARVKREIERLSNCNEIVQTIKAFDRLDNLESLVEYDHDFAETYLGETNDMLKSFSLSTKVYDMAMSVCSSVAIRLI